MIFLPFILVATQLLSQEILQEFVIEKDTPPDVTEIFKEYGCTPEDGVLVFNTSIPNLQFSIPDAPNRLRHVSSYDENSKRYVLCVQPTDGVGGYTKYIVVVNGNNYKPEMQIVSAIKSGLTQYFMINPKNDPMIEIRNLQKEVDELKKMQGEKRQQFNVAAPIQQPQTTVKQSNQIQQNREVELNFVFNVVTNKRNFLIKIYLDNQIIGETNFDKGFQFKYIDKNPGKHGLGIKWVNPYTYTYSIGNKQWYDWNNNINTILQSNFIFDYKKKRTGFGVDYSFELNK